MTQKFERSGIQVERKQIGEWKVQFQRSIDKRIPEANQFSTSFEIIVRKRGEGKKKEEKVKRKRGREEYRNE